MNLKSHFIPVMFLPILFSLSMGCSEPLNKREQGGLFGLGMGAGTGAIIGSTVGHAAVGALIGGPIGLIGGALQVNDEEEQSKKNGWFISYPLDGNLKCIEIVGSRKSCKETDYGAHRSIGDNIGRSDCGDSRRSQPSRAWEAGDLHFSRLHPFGSLEQLSRRA